MQLLTEIKQPSQRMPRHFLLVFWKEQRQRIVPNHPSMKFLAKKGCETTRQWLCLSVNICEDKKDQEEGHRKTTESRRSSYICYTNEGY